MISCRRHGILSETGLRCDASPLVGGRVFELKCEFGKELDRCRETLIVDEIEKVSDRERDRVDDAVL